MTRFVWSRSRGTDPLMGGRKRWLLAGPLIVVMIPLLILPLIYILRLSFDIKTVGVQTEGVWSVAGWQRFLTDAYTWGALIRTLKLAGFAALGCLMIGFPYAYFVNERIGWKQLQLGALLAPLLVNMVARIYGWQAILSSTGIVNKTLIGINLIDTPLQLMNTEFAVVLAMVHVLLPYMVLAIYGVLRSIPSDLVNAARGLGSSRLQAFFKVTLPLSAPGVSAGFILVFTLACGSFLLPTVMGGGWITTLPTLIYQYTENLNWPVASILALMLVAITVPPIIFYQRRSLRNRMAAR